MRLPAFLVALLLGVAVPALAAPAPVLAIQEVLRVTVEADVSAAVLHGAPAVTQSDSQEACLFICLPEKPDCAEHAYAKQFGECWTCCTEISSPSSALAVAAHSTPVAPTDAEQGVCWRACFSVDPQCPFGWEAKKLGDCWTCCRDESDDSLPAVAARLDIAAPAETMHQGICWRACFPESPACPPGWEAKKLGECWTCCRGESDVSLPAVAARLDIAAPVETMHQDVCWRTCFHEKKECPPGLEAKKLGECWTCCFDESDVSLPAVAARLGIAALQEAKTTQQEGICWLACFSKEPGCPGGWYSENKEGCWTCCKDGPPPAAVAARPSIAPPRQTLQQGICLAICAPEKPECSEGWTPQKFGVCWTCCRDEDPGADSLPTEAAARLDIAAPHQTLLPGICRSICFRESIKCPEGWVPTKLGKCWTCCTDAHDDAQQQHLGEPGGNFDLRRV